MQAVHAEALRIDRRAQQITIVEQESTVTFRIDGLAVTDAGESGVGTQTLGYLPGQPRTGRSVAAFNAHQDQARSQPVPYLVQQQLLLWCGTAGQECR